MAAPTGVKTLKRPVYQGDPLAASPPADLQAILDRYRNQPDALITILEEIQSHYGYLPRQMLQYAARELGFPLSRLYGIATFYNLFRLQPPGRHRVRVCRGTACHVNHSLEILQDLERRLGIHEDETTPDGQITLQTVACMGACSLAPVLVVNEHTYGRMTPEQAWETVSRVRDDVGSD